MSDEAILDGLVRAVTPDYGGELAYDPAAFRRALAERGWRVEPVDAWEAFAQNAENMQNQCPGPERDYHRNKTGWRLACCEFARQARAMLAAAKGR